MNMGGYINTDHIVIYNLRSGTERKIFTSSTLLNGSYFGSLEILVYPSLKLIDDSRVFWTKWQLSLQISNHKLRKQIASTTLIADIIIASLNQ
jgi:hypothetical protein